MSYNTKNHIKQGGDKWIIGGTLEIQESAIVTGLAADPLLAATDSNLGGVRADAKTVDDTVPAKIGEDGKLYVPAYPELTAATDEILGGVIADAKTEDDTIPVKIDEDGKLYVPAYPELTAAEHQEDSAAEDLPSLLAEFNALLSKLIAAGLMEAEEQ